MMHAGELIDGRFEIEQPIGAGGMGHVYRARDRQSGERVAVKVLVRTSRARAAGAPHAARHGAPRERCRVPVPSRPRPRGRLRHADRPRAAHRARAERQALASAEALELAPSLRPVAVAALAQARLGLGRTEEALDAARAAYPAIEALGGVEEGESLIRLTYAEALAASGAHADALEAITSAEAVILARAGKFHEPLWRDSFLERVPEHARTRALAARWLRGERP